MGAWDTGIFDNDSAADWSGDFDEAENGDQLAVITGAFDAVLAADEPADLDLDDCAYALAAAASVAALVPGGPPADESYGPETLAESGVEVTDQLKAHAIAAVKKVLLPESEWSVLWDEADSLAEATEPVAVVLRVLQG